MKETILKYGIPATIGIAGLTAGWLIGRNSGKKKGERDAYKKIAESQAGVSKIFADYREYAEEEILKTAGVSPEEAEKMRKTVDEKLEREEEEEKKKGNSSK